MTLLDSTSLSAVLSAAIATIVSLYVAKKTLKDQEVSKLHDEILQVNMIAINYPCLEQDSFCRNYDPNCQDESSLRYDNYCCIVFNSLQRIRKHFKGDKVKIENFYGAKEMVVRHQKWWVAAENHGKNVYGYDLAFCAFIDGYLHKSILD